MKRKNINEIQAYSGIAIVFVVLLHAIAYYLFEVLKINGYADGSFITIFIDNIIHISVPMFIFIAGYKYELTKNSKSLKEYYISRIKIVKPFLAVSTFFIVLHLITLVLRGGTTNILVYTKEFIVSIIMACLGYNRAYQLWYIPMYMMIVLSYPIIRIILKNNRLRIIILTITILCFSLLSYKFKILDTKPFNFIYYFYMFELGVFFFNHKEKIKYKKQILILYLAMIIVVSLTKNSLTSKILKEMVYNPIAVIAMYYVAQYLKDSKLLLWLGKYSFAIFLLHEPIFVQWISATINSLGLYNSWILTIPISICGTILSVLAYKLLVKTYIGKKTLSIN